MIRIKHQNYKSRHYNPPLYQRGVRGDLTNSNQQMIFGLHRKLIIDQNTKIKYRTFLRVAVD